MAETFLATLLVLGFVLGLKHALDADHVVAVSTIVSETRSLKKSSLAGVIWGIGHTVTLLLVGLLVLGFRLSIPADVALYFEFLVGIVLVALGVDVLRKTSGDKIHQHQHKHESVAHTHAHLHESDAHSHVHKVFAIGVAHGLAGSAALMLLVLASVQSLVQGLLYIFVFGIGSILGMLVISTIIGLPFLLTKKFERIDRAVKVIAGGISILLGIIIMYEIGLVLLNP